CSALTRNVEKKGWKAGPIPTRTDRTFAGSRRGNWQKFRSPSPGERSRRCFRVASKSCHKAKYLSPAAGFFRLGILPVLHARAAIVKPGLHGFSALVTRSQVP